MSFRIRAAKQADLEGLRRLSGLMQLINLPNDAEELLRKCETSERAFAGKIKRMADAQYLFVLEDSETGDILGTSSIIAQHGTLREPHMYFEVGLKNHYSSSIGRGFSHEVLRLKFDTDGPTEIGGLVLHPQQRKSGKKLGRLLSFARFMYMGLFPERFRESVLAELQPPFLPSGSSLLWEAVGRKFTHMTYHEADRLSRRNKEFITSLFPKGDLYVGLLPEEVRAVIGKVGSDTEPVRHMLEKIGFRYLHMIDPFDGGPHFWADLKEITLIQKLKKAVLREGHGEASQLAIVGTVSGPFHCVQTHVSWKGQDAIVPEAALRSLGLTTGQEAAILLLDA